MSKPIIVTEGDLEKEVIIESGECYYSGIDGLEKARAVVEAQDSTIVKGKTPKNCLRIKLPVGYVDKDTANGNFYEMDEMNKALETCKEGMIQGLVHGAHGEHPQGRADVRPDEISHLVTKAWVDPKTKYLWNEWLIVPTEKGGGKDLQELFLAGASIGTSIRGTAVREEKRYMRHYTFKGTDTVAVPSTGMKPGIRREENLRATIEVESLEIASESLAILKEGNDMAGKKLADELAAISESLKTVGEGKAGATDLINLGSQIGALEERVGSMEAQTEEKKIEIKGLTTKLHEINKIKSALESERDEKVKESSTFKDTIQDLSIQVEALEGEVARKQIKLDTSIVAIEQLREKLTSDVEKPEGDATVDEIQAYAEKCESVIEAARDYVLFLEDGIENVKEYALECEANSGDGKSVENLIPIIEALRDAAKTGVVEAKKEKKKPKVNMEQYIKHLTAINPSLKVFAEELAECTTVAQVEARQAKYLDMISKNAEVVTHESLNDKKVARGIERFLPHLR